MNDERVYRAERRRLRSLMVSTAKLARDVIPRESHRQAHDTKGKGFRPIGQ
jgi:hypothetical protein